jgi:hypothetical protein
MLPVEGCVLLLFAFLKTDEDVFPLLSMSVLTPKILVKEFVSAPPKKIETTIIAVVVAINNFLK